MLALLHSEQPKLYGVLAILKGYMLFQKLILFFLEKSKTDEWKLSLKERKSSKVKGERVPPVGASADQSHDDISLRGKGLLIKRSKV